MLTPCFLVLLLSVAANAQDGETDDAEEAWQYVEFLKTDIKYVEQCKTQFQVHVTLTIHDYRISNET